MDADVVRRLVDAGETFTVEFKGEQRQPFNDRSLIEAAVCLANGRGGTLLVGVEDDGSLTGARPRHEGGVTDPARVAALIANQTVPPVQVAVTLVDLEGLHVLAVAVENHRRVVGTSRGLYVRRALRTDGSPKCVPYPAHEMLAHEINRGAMDYAALPVAGATWDDLDPWQFERLRRLVRRDSSGADRLLADLSDVDIARALGVLDATASSPTPLSGALLLFGYAEALQRHIPTHQGAFQVLSGTTVHVNDSSHAPLFELAEDLHDRLMVRNDEQELEAGLVRVSIPRFPEAVVRELVANALVHRDYTMLGATQVQLSDDILTISNPGGFPEGVRLDNLLSTQRPRSPLLADAFKRAGLVERTGRGINRVYQTLLSIGRDEPDYTRSTEHAVVAVVSVAEADIALARFFLEHERDTGRPFHLADLQVIHELKREGPSSTDELGHVLQTGALQARTVLTRLQEQGMVEPRGSGRGRSWHLSAATYRALDARAAYPRIRGFDRIQQEQMLLSYVAAHGRITRSEAADLGGLTPAQATQALKELVDSGRLEKHGERRWTFYTLPSPS